MEQVIKFRLIYNKEVFAYERLTENGWQWMILKENNRYQEIWNKGTIIDSHKLIREQFTGLTDKQGKEIYVGDKFCDFHNKERFGVVKFGEYDSTQSTDGLIIYGGRVGFYVDFNSDFMRKDLGFWSRHSEIIGNIHQNSK